MNEQIKWSTLVENNPDGEWSHAGVSVLSDGRLVYADLGGSSLVYFDLENMQKETISIGTADAHGIHVVNNTIWIADIGPGLDEGQVLRINQAGEVQQRLSSPDVYLQLSGPWKPTSIAVVQEEGVHKNDLWVADGYGQSLIHKINTSGEVISLRGDGKGINFDCPHGITLDTRNSPSTVAVADRGNKRIVFFDLDGNFLRSVSDPIMTSPSSIAVWEDQLVITDLFGAILCMDRNDQIEYLVETESAQDRQGWPNRIINGKTVAPILQDGIANSPHGIAVDQESRIFFTEWLIGGRFVMLNRHSGS